MPPLATDLFDYPLPPHLVAQTPAACRDQSRLLVVHRATRELEHTGFAELPRFLRAGDILFRNTAAVLPARLHAQRPTGGKVECFLLRPVECDPAAVKAAGEVWSCLVQPGKKLPVGATFTHATGAFTGAIVAKEAGGTVRVRFTTPGGETITALAHRLGEVPLPPYIQRADPPGETTVRCAQDRVRYQTVYADMSRPVAVAAPTAGLHFTPELLTTLAALGVTTADLTLHVGLGTFRPITTATVGEHAIHRERYEIPAATRRALGPPCPGRRIAVGTTSVRSLEDYLAKRNESETGNTGALDQPHVAEAGIFIQPPHHFRGVDALITNFHQPRSTLLCLVAAFLTPGSTDGIAWLREIYAEAVAREYRFFSYGDAMLIL